MTSIDIKKNKFNQLAATCFDEKTLQAVTVDEILKKSETNCYYAVFSVDHLLSAEEETGIIKRSVSAFTGMMNVQFFFNYTALALSADEIVLHINHMVYNMFEGIRPYMKDMVATLDGDRYQVQFKNEFSRKTFLGLGIDAYIAEYLLFSFKIKTSPILKIDQSIIGTDVSDIKVFEPEPEPEDLKAEGETKTTPKKKKKAPQKPVGRMLMGSSIRKRSIKICDINDEMNKATIEGEVIDVDDRTCRNGSKLILFHVTDFSSTILCKIFVNQTRFKTLFDGLKNSRIKMDGEISFDVRTKAFTLKPINIMILEKERREDTAEEKRVELHLHTVMSEEDATIQIVDVVKRAKEYGHSALAITDHGVLQAFPAAHSAAKKAGIDIIFGMEAYMTLNEADAYSGTRNVPLEGEYVVMDIETTGFSPVTEAITEIGAVRIKDRKIVDTFSTFVDPERPIPLKIVKLTGITADMVKGAPSQAKAIQMFKDFAGDACLVAHNANFDMSFFRAGGERYGIQFKNPLLDTLTLSRCLIPENKRHDLKTMTSYFNISLDHHRAMNDAQATAEALLRFFEMMDAMEILGTGDMNASLADLVNRKDTKVYHTILLCKNKVGLKNLYKIVSKSHIDGFYRKPRISKKYIEKHREGLLIGSACESGELFQAILKEYAEKSIERIAAFYDYLEIQPIGNNEFLVRDGKVLNDEGLRDLNRRIVTLGEKQNKMVVATCDAHFLDAKDAISREILQTAKKYDDAHFQPPLYFRTTTEMLDEFAYLGEDKAKEVVVTNTNKIYQQIQKFDLLPKEPAMPKIENAGERITKLAYDTAREMYGDVLPEIVKTRLDREMNAIVTHGYSVLYLIAHLLIKDSLDNGYIVGSRGSVGSSLAARMTGVTEVNPLPPHYRCGECQYSDFDVDKLKYSCGVDLPPKTCPKCGKPLIRSGFDIPFETFLGLNADKVPDIDLNFSSDYQPKAHQWTIDYFGEKHVFRAGTISTISDKTAFGYVKNYLETNQLTAPHAEIMRLAKGITGVKRTTGQHPGGLVVLPKDKDVFDYTPVQKPANDMTSKSITTHYDFDSLHDTLVKLDILGHDDPTMLKMLSDITGVDARTVPLNDEATMTLFSSQKALNLKVDKLLDSDVGTFGVPEFGTKFVRGVLTLTRPTTMAELVRISGLSHGTNVWQGNADQLIESGAATLGDVIATRDDIYNTLVEHEVEPKLAFFTMESVRKGRGLNDEMMKAMSAVDLPSWYIESCQKISYMFPKAHAVAYVTMALRVAYFKVHYPEAYYAAYFTVRADNFDASFVDEGELGIEKAIKEIERKQKDFSATANENSLLIYLEVAYEMYSRGIGFLPVDLERSHAKEYRIESEGIRLPFAALPGIGENAAINLYEQQQVKAYISKEDIKNRAKASKTVLEALENSGCLSEITNENQISFFD